MLYTCEVQDLNKNAAKRSADAKQRDKEGLQRGET